MRNTMKQRAEKVLRLLEAKWEVSHRQGKHARQRGDELNEQRHLYESCAISDAEMLVKAIIENDTKYIDKICKIYEVR